MTISYATKKSSMTEGASADSGQASRGASQTQDAGSGSDQQATTPSTSPAKTQDSQSAVKRRTLYDRLTHDIQHDHKVKQEVRMGKRIGFYKLKGQLGAGNFAKVKLGVHLLTTGKPDSRVCVYCSLISKHNIFLSASGSYI